MSMVQCTRLTEHCGVVLNGDPSLSSLADLEDTDVREHYVTQGAVLFRGFRTDMDAFDGFTSRFLADCVTNGNDTREAVAGYTHIQSVNSGSQHISLHSEMAYSPLRPDIVFFYCVEPPTKAGGATLLCDGIAVWRRMKPATRTLFEKKKIRYRFIRSQLLGSQIQDSEAELKGHQGVALYQRHADGTADMDFIVPASQPAKHAEALAFANSVIVEDASASWEDGSAITRDLRLELFELTVRLSHRVAWRAGDILMIDNSRLMHGREAIAPGDGRRIVIKMGREAR